MLQKATDIFNVKYPIIQAPMAGGVTTTRLVTEVANGGGLGMIGAGYMSPNQLRKQIQEVQQLTPNPFGVNLFVPNEFHVTEEEILAANEKLNQFRLTLQIPEKKIVEKPDFNDLYNTFLEQVDVVIKENVPICSFTFGVPTTEVIDRLKQHDILLMGTATTVKEAIALEKAGMDIIVVQGSEAGGHRGNFLKSNNESMMGIMSLIPQVVDNVSIPVIAAGGIMDGRGFMASLCLGAQGVQMGTAFLTCLESGANELHKTAILNAKEDQTVVTRSFSGKWARGIQNEFISSMRANEQQLPAFPVQNSLTKDIRKAGASQGKPEFMSLWAGQNATMAKKQTVGMLMESIIAEAKGLGFST
ncbi:NAD(P)H-dependent flavin oxidoreductase [Oceanobacillus manasiensis]|uniref:NAD(P)H-dependent flavin oxidoreductase n=1 Tax=Oceanobacillus manasiensis TaxID=586413 RepID=UPI0005AA5E8B|nr:nitronate monooxygenase [Oceanobacillus manasiensis]